ncbi:MAG: hypothetical protein A3F16_08775 [Deltaproteobacteria bacterium RIFCSPHIGHO2_12_FULL_43_9]|nr:MAG: hypothetical protein A3F16_08775 [Deltaproteobacteria bacterium RIFCSPHIGHO2_12_FULL_43_9]
MNKFVLDCSVTMGWCFREESDSYVAKILYSFEDAEAVVPFLWCYEVCNVLTLAERKKRISTTEATRFLSIITELPIIIDEKSDVMKDILVLARHHEISAYDAAYLELALRLGLPLATLDRGLTAVLEKTGIKKY